MQSYFYINAHVAYVRGLLIFSGTRAKTERNSEINSSLAQVSAHERIHKKNLTALRDKIKDILNKKMFLYIL